MKANDWSREACTFEIQGVRDSKISWGRFLWGKNFSYEGMGDMMPEKEWGNNVQLPGISGHSRPRVEHTQAVSNTSSN
jgi:hypothetical protein